MKKILILLWFVFMTNCYSQPHSIAVYKQDPIADSECAETFFNLFKTQYNTIYLTHETLTSENLINIDCLVFPGGLGDSSEFSLYLEDKKKIVQDFFNAGKIYIGSCMGAYLADKLYFGLLEDVSVRQYIKRRRSETKLDKATVVKCNWLNNLYMMYFYDGPVFLGKISPQEKIAEYKNGDVAAILKKTNTGIFIGVGPHPESTEDWYDTKRLKKFWHQGSQHRLILDLLNSIPKNNLKDENLK